MKKNFLVYLIIITLCLPIISITSINSLDGDSNVQDVKFYDDYLYVADDEGLKIYDVEQVFSGYTEPTLVGQFACENIMDISINSGMYAYLAVQDYGLKAVDIRNKANPVLWAEYNVASGGNYGVNHVANTVYLSNSLWGFYILYVLEGSVTEVGSYTVAGSSCFDMLYEFEFVGENVHDFAIITDDGDFKILNITSSSSIFEVGEVPSYSFRFNSICWGSRYDFMVCVASEMDGLAVIDVSDRASPNIVFTNPSSYSDIYGNPASSRDNIVCAKQNGFDIWDISTPASSVRISQTTIEGKYISQVVFESGGYLYVVTKGGEILIYDIDDPHNPILLEPENNFPWIALIITAVVIAIIAVISIVYIKNKKKSDITSINESQEDFIQDNEITSESEEQLPVKSDSKQIEMIYCWKCGNPNTRDEIHCSSCGEELTRKE